MYKQILVVTSVGLGGIAAGSLSSELSHSVRAVLAGLRIPGMAEAQNAAPKPTGDHGHAHGTEKGHADGHKEGPEGFIKMSADQITAAKIAVAAVGPGILARRLTVPGVITPDANRIARVAAKVVGTVSELKKRLGDNVAKGEVVATLESREVADAKSEFISAQVFLDLQKTLFEREQSLFQKNITGEQQFLKARQTFTEAQLRSDLARHKLSALNITDQEVSGLARQTPGLQRYEIRAAAPGKIVERLVDLGAPVGGEGQAKELYVIADLSSVWIELSVSVSDLPAIKESQRVSISSGADGKATEGKIIFISPMLNQDTRAARVIAEIENNDLTWRPGSYVSAQILVDEQSVEARVPRSALQTIGGETVVFVRNADGFEKREVAVGGGDAQSAEIVFGLDPGEDVAITNTFVLKADLGKSEAEHSH